MKFPTVILTSVIRGSKFGETHGGIYLLNFNNSKHRCVYDWDDPAIEWRGRGGDRGLRGIVFRKDLIYIAAANELFVFNKRFQIQYSFTNPNLLDCHEITIKGDSIYLSATGTNSILQLDLSTGEFVKGYKLMKAPTGKRFLKRYDPNNETIPRGGLDHINSVYFWKGRIYFSGLFTSHLFALDTKTDRLEAITHIPYGTHNVIPYKGGYVMNHTSRDRIWYQRKGHNRSWNIINYEPGTITEAQGIARQAFGRGLTTWGDWIIGGSSPSTVSCYHFKTGEVKHHMLTNEIRNTVHGLEVWPYQ